MRTECIYSVVHDRKGDGKGLIQIVILFPNRSRKFISTGYYIPKNEWDEENRVIINNPLARRMNKSIHSYIQKFRDYEIMLAEKGKPFTSKDVEAALGRKSSKSFIDFMKVELDKMTLAGAVKYLHIRARTNLEAVGVTFFSDLTYDNIQEFDLLLKSKLKAQTSVSKQHSVIKTYIHLAQNKKLMQEGDDPYNTFKVPKGKPKIRTRLDDTEIQKFMDADVPDHLQLSKDLFVLQMFTGLSWKDIENLTKQNIRTNADGSWIEGLRKKNGEYYTVYLLPEALEILNKYQFKAPVQQKQNLNLKLLAAIAKINKNITTHTGRHTAASWMLRKGIPLAVIKDILGHQDIDTTLIYAKLEKETIKDEMLRAFAPQSSQIRNQ